MCYKLELNFSARDPKMRWIIVTVFLLCVGLGTAATDAVAATVIYRWVDDNGVVHFGNQPPIDVQATVVGESSSAPSRVSAPATAASGEPATEQADGEPELSYAEQRRQERDKRRNEYSEEQRRLRGECEIMRRQRDWVEPSTQVLVEGDDGNPRRLSDEERLELLAEAKAFIAENCD